jgi:hypothetical protein
MKVFQLAPFPYFSIGNELKVTTTTHDAYVKVKLKFEVKNMNTKKFAFKV